MSITVIPVSLLLISTYFIPFFSVPGTEFEHEYLRCVSMTIFMPMESYKVIEALFGDEKLKLAKHFQNSKIAALTATLPSQLILIGSKSW